MGEWKGMSGRKEAMKGEKREKRGRRDESDIGRGGSHMFLGSGVELPHTTEGGGNSLLPRGEAAPPATCTRPRGTARHAN